MLHIRLLRFPVWTHILMASIMAISIFVLQSISALAAPPPCAIGTPLDASAGSASCIMTITAVVNPGVLTLQNDAAATVPGSPFTLTGAPINATFTFRSIVTDHRGSTNGWTLSAASTGIANGATNLPLTLTGLDPASPGCTTGSCPPLTVLMPVTLSATPAPYLKAGNAAHTIVVDGVYNEIIDGAFTVPPGSPAGTYSGTVTITLTNSF